MTQTKVLNSLSECTLGGKALTGNASFQLKSLGGIIAHSSIHLEGKF